MASTDPLRHVVVIGGGIAGMYCARLLARSRVRHVTVFETRSAFGGRIETGDLRGFIPGHRSGSGAALTPATRPAFKAEFGPMRFELDIQPLFDRLCKDLGIAFSPFGAPVGKSSPVQYPLPPDECESNGKTPLAPLELLKLGVFRMFGKATATNGDKVEIIDTAWLAGLQDDLPPGDARGFEHLRAQSRSVAPPPAYLHETGFKNALSDVLSPLAVKAIENEGTFYSLLAENPSAVEWGIFWLRLFKLGKSTLSTVPGGVRTVTERLQAELETTWRHQVELKPSHQVIAVRPLGADQSGVAVDFVDQRGPARTQTLIADHAILALPKVPLKALSARFPSIVRRYIDDVIAFPLLKIFVAGAVPPWWPSAGTPDPQTHAWSLSTREVHYFRDESGLNGMTLLYMDAPMARYWQHFLRAPQYHDRAEYGNNPALKRELVLSLLAERRVQADAKVPKSPVPRETRVDATDPAAGILLQLAEAFREDLRPVAKPGSQLEAWLDLGPEEKAILTAPKEQALIFFAGISDYAIRDWSRMPFGAGCHAWAPKSRSWDARRALRAFALQGSRVENVHVCGEAYSDYQGFIEGALRSAEDAVAATVGTPVPHSAP